MAGTQKINGFYFKVSYDTIYVGNMWRMIERSYLMHRSINLSISVSGKKL